MQTQINFPVIVQVVYTDGRIAELLIAHNAEEMDGIIKTAVSSNSQAFSYSVFQFVGKKMMSRQWVDVPYECNGEPNNG